MSVAGSLETSATDEVGYLFLEGCSVKIVEEDRAAAEDKFPVGKWVDVAFDSASSVEKTSNGHEGPAMNKQSDQIPNESCARCDLLIQSRCPNTTDDERSDHRNPLEWFLKFPPRFEGTMADVKATPNLCSLMCERVGNRSDAVLLAGVAFSCQDYGHIAIRKVQVLLEKPSLDSKQRLARRNSTEQTIAVECDSACSSHRATLVITFAIPQITNEIGPSSRPRCIQDTKKTLVKGSSKALPPCTQLLLSLLRSDWEFLETKIKSLAEPCIVGDSTTSSIRKIWHDGTLTTTECTYFPPELSLDELYTRISGASDGVTLFGGSQPPSECPLTSLPEEVLTTLIASYLRAGSLDALRCTCTFFHHTLRSVVPGLKLRLYAHQIRSLTWMRRRESRSLSENEILRLDRVGSGYVGGDLHRAATGGASVCLRRRKPLGLSAMGKNTFRINQHDGREYINGVEENQLLVRHAARGGLLCDDPGLGKTITVLALILQTAGLTFELPEWPYVANSTTIKTLEGDEQVFQAYWEEHVPGPFRRQLMSKLISSLRKYTESRYFETPVDPVEDGCANYLDVVKHPMAFKQIIQQMHSDEDYGRNFEQFRSDINQCFQNAMTYYPPDHPIHLAAVRLLEVFIAGVKELTKKQTTSAKKSFARATSKPNSSVAAILEQHERRDLLASMIRSSGTLLVVPGTLLNHWEEQLRKHADFAYFSKRIPLFFHFTSSSESHLQEVRRQCDIEMTHFPCVFLDITGSKPLPSATFLARFLIVITTHQRFANEWKNGKLQLEQDTNDSNESAPFEVGTMTEVTGKACSLLKIRWPRLIVDEGHAMGRGTQNNSILFASWISAQRRWAMTGTPTSQTVSNSGLSNLRGLMNFLQHHFFSARFEGDKIWQHNVANSWRTGSIAGFFRLQSLLSLLMVRHTKLEITELPLPTFKRTLSAMSKEEITTYNTLVCAIQSNLLITSMEGKTSGLRDSLLHRSQTKHARVALSNLRLVSSGGTRVVPTLERKFWEETVELLQSHGVEGVKLKVIDNYLHRAVTEQLSGCMRCGMQLSTLLVLPCADLICTECMNNNARSCPICQQSFDVDDFQLLQPGFDYLWHWNLDEALTKAARHEQQMNGTAQDEYDEDIIPLLEAHDPAGQVAMQPARVRRRTKRFGDGHTCMYDLASSEGKCIYCLHEHSECILPDEHSRCLTCYRTPEPCPSEESKFFYIINKLTELRALHLNRTSTSLDTASSYAKRDYVAEDIRPLKVIVFSQFRRIINLGGHRLLRRFGGGCVAEYWGATRRRELLKFTTSQDCFCMLLGKDGSEGLDLSFVTHIFFLEEVWDKSMESQVIARAWRMGAKGRVDVEILTAQNSVEDTMAHLELRLPSGTQTEADVGLHQAESRVSSENAIEYQRAKMIFLLKNVRFIRNDVNARNSTNGKRPRAFEPCAPADGEEDDRKTKAVRFQD